MDIYKQIQKKTQHNPMLAPKQANEKRWNGCQDETKHADMTMGDVNYTIKELLSPDGDDFDMLTTKEIHLRILNIYPTQSMTRGC